MSAPSQSERTLRVDAHVHFHDGYDEGTFLDAAAANMALRPSDSELVHGALCLTETASANWFEALLGTGPDVRFGAGQWRIAATEERNCVLAVDRNERALAIIAGRQIVTAEGIEVLALGFADAISDGQAAAAVLTTVSNAGAITVLPWGFGKWVGARGDLVRRLLDDPPCSFNLGDNGCRLSSAPEPRLLADARQRGIGVLPGTDPFPFPWDSTRVGSFGMEWLGGLAADRPFEDLKQFVANVVDARPYGRLEGIPGFLRNQFAIQVRKMLLRWSR
jgi:hypothetical protein